MRYLALLILFFITNSLFAQETTRKTFKDTNVCTEMVSYYDNGQINEIGHFDSNGKLDKQWIKYDKQGEILVMGYFSNGIKTGKWLFWNEENTLKEVVFVQNKISNYKEWTAERSLVSN